MTAPKQKKGKNAPKDNLIVSFAKGNRTFSLPVPTEVSAKMTPNVLFGFYEVARKELE